MIVGLDLEGPVFRPGLDLAWRTVDRLWDADLRHRRGDLERFDRWDDLWYLAERSRRGPRHSTGTTPLVASLGASGCGAATREWLRLAAGMERNPGAREMVRALDEAHLLVLITSGGPALGLSLAREAGVAFSRVFTHGSPPRPGRRSLVEEVEARWPRALRHPALKSFVRAYLDLVPPRYTAARAAAFRRASRARVRALPGPLRRPVETLLVEEVGVRGGHAKLRALQEFGPPGVAIGDSIVDAEMVRGARWGVALNCTAPLTLAAARWTVATDDVTLLPELVAVLESGGDPRALETPDFRLFDARDFRRSPRKVLRAHREFKARLATA